MAQDLTPQLRTRLSKVERAVGVFVTLATLVLIAGFAYYIYHTAKRKGWFVTTIKYQTSINNASGLKPGDPVMLMGFSVGEITEVTPNDPNDYYNVTVYFKIRADHYGYIWTDSQARVAGADFLGKRFLEITKGRDGISTVLFSTNHQATAVLHHEKVEQKVDETFQSLTNAAMTQRQRNLTSDEIAQIKSEAVYAVKVLVYKERGTYFQSLKKEYERYWIKPQESPAITERLELLADTVEKALPNILGLTNQLYSVLTKAESATETLDEILTSSRPTIENLAVLSSNLTVMTSNLNSGPGALGQWLIPTNTQIQIDELLASANSTLSSTETNLVITLSNLNLSLISLAGITSNLNQQVASNPTLVSNISSLIVRSDEMMQGLKKHWLLRSAFKDKKTNAPSTRPTTTRGGKGK